MVAAIVAPIIAGTWRPRPNASILVPFSAKERSDLSAQIEKSRDCRIYQDKSSEDTLGSFVCELDRERLADGGHQTKTFSLFLHVVTNAVFMMAVFAIIYALVIVTFDIVRRYFEWLRT